MTSEPRRMPLSYITVILSPTAAWMAGSTSIGEGARSSWRAPWFDTMMPSTPMAAARVASSGCMTPLSTSLPGHRRRKVSTSCQSTGEGVCEETNSATCHGSAPAGA